MDKYSIDICLWSFYLCAAHENQPFIHFTIVGNSFLKHAFRQHIIEDNGFELDIQTYTMQYV